MRFLRPVAVLGLLATALVLWLSTRMWGGSVPWVWRLSCVLGAWAPLCAAATFLYVREVGEREDSVLVAWLVRAIGMHWVLTWMVGASDWLRGPPGSLARWNADAGAPVVLLGFLPVAWVAWRTLRWLRELGPRLAGEVWQPARPDAHRAGPAFRGVRMVSAGRPVASWPSGAWALCAAALALASALPSLGLWLVCGAALLLGPLAARNYRALVPAVLGATGAGALTALRSDALARQGALVHAMATPWWMLLSLGLVLAATELSWRGARTSPPRPPSPEGERGEEKLRASKLRTL